MGTSQSSSGPGAGVPMVPPWTPAPPTGDAQNDSPYDNIDAAPADPLNGADTNAPPVMAPQQSPLAPPARFQGTRTNLGDFARTGDAHSLGRSLRHYVRTGYGGSGTTTRRFGGTATTAGALGNALARVASGQPASPGNPLDPALLAGRSAQEVMDAVVEAVRPVDGTQDTEAARTSIREALSELLTRFPEADLLNLDDDQRSFAIERFTANDVFHRFQLDTGKTIIEKAPSPTTALARLKQVRDYVKEAVAASFRKLRNAGKSLTAGRISHVVRDALRETFLVFEGYIE